MRAGWDAMKAGEPQAKPGSEAEVFFPEWQRLLDDMDLAVEVGFFWTHPDATELDPEFGGDFSGSDLREMVLAIERAVADLAKGLHGHDLFRHLTAKDRLLREQIAIEAARMLDSLDFEELKSMAIRARASQRYANN